MSDDGLDVSIFIFSQSEGPTLSYGTVKFESAPELGLGHWTSGCFVSRMTLDVEVRTLMMFVLGGWIK
jgi:hypothetical protein